MVPVTNIWKMVLDLLVPQHARVARFDTLRPAVIARTATTAHVVRAIPCIAPFPYDHRIVRDAVHAAKFHGHQRAAWILGAALAPFVAEELADHRMLGEFLSPAIVPVPLHATRLRERGYIQA